MTTDILSSADTINRHLGARLRHLRKQRGLSLQTCGDILGVTYQQVQKYEKGINRLSVATLVRIARSYGIAPASFFEGLDDTRSSSDPDAHLRSLQECDQYPDYKLIRAIARLSPLLQHLINELVLAVEQSQAHRRTLNPTTSSTKTETQQIEAAANLS